MFGWGVNMNRNSAPKLLSDPNVKLETVLADRTFNNLLRNENSHLIDFLSRDDNVNKMYSYLLTDEFDSNNDAKKIRFLCLNVLTSESEKLGEKLITNKVYSENLINFSTSKFSRDTIKCGYYSYLIESLAKASSGDILSSKFQFLTDYLMNNIDIMSLRQLFVKLVINFTYPFRVSSKMMEYLVSHMFKKDENETDEKSKYTQLDSKALYVAFSIQGILKSASHLGSLFDSPNLLQTLMKLAIYNYKNNAILSSTIFNCLSIILKNASKSDDSILANDNGNIDIDNYEKILNIDSNETPFTSNAATPEAIKLFPKSASSLVIKVLKSELPTFVCEVVVSTICRFSVEKLQNFCTQHHLSNEIISLYKDYKHRKTNGHFLLIAKALSDKGICCCEEHQEAWTKFEQFKFIKRYKKSMAEYGGEVNESSKQVQKDLFKSMDDLYSAYLLLEEEEEEAKEEPENKQVESSILCKD